MDKIIDTRTYYVHDNNGYKYRINKSNYKCGKQPQRFGKNPFIKDNIHNYLRISFPHLHWIDDDDYSTGAMPFNVICDKHRDKGIQKVCLNYLKNQGTGCKYCGYEKRVKRIDSQIIKSRCAELNIIYLGRFIKNQETWIEYMCKKHMEKGRQTISWYHLKTCAVGCPYCTGRYKSTNDFKEEIKRIDSNIIILGEYSGSEGHILCRCKICGKQWSPIARSLKNGQGCPNCIISKGERRIMNILDNKSIKYIFQKTFQDCVSDNNTKLRFDFYLPQHNTIIEYDGEQHYHPVDFGSKGKEYAKQSYIENKQRDLIKDEYCKNKNIKLIRIPYYDFNKINNYIELIITTNYLQNP